MTVHIATSDLRPAERFSYWSEVVCRTYAPVEARSLGDRSFEGTVSISDLGGLRVTKIGSEPMRYERGRGTVAENPCENFFIGLTVKGTTGLDQDGRQSAQKVGEMVAYDSGRPYTNIFPETYDQIVLVVPRSQLIARLPHVDQLTAMTLPCTTPAGNMARRMFEELGCYDETLGNGAASQLAASVLDVFTLAMQVELGGGQTALESGACRLEGIKRYLLKNLEDPTLTVDRIAKDNAVSIRSLHRLFATDGDAVMHWLYLQRLHSGYRALVEKRICNVTEAAMAFGFADASHFARSFKKAFGIQPSALLRGSPTMVEIKTFPQTSRP